MSRPEIPSLSTLSETQEPAMLSARKNCLFLYCNTFTCNSDQNQKVIGKELPLSAAAGIQTVSSYFIKLVHPSLVEVSQLLPPPQPGNTQTPRFPDPSSLISLPWYFGVG